jgi:hypothetical protein
MELFIALVKDFRASEYPDEIRAEPPVSSVKSKPVKS